MRRKTLLKAGLMAAVGAAVAPTSACAAVADTSTAATDPYKIATSAEPDDEAKATDREKIRQILSGNDPVTWVFTGDSITQGAAHTHGWRHYVQHFEERVRWELQRKWDFVVNTGVSGERSSHIVNDFDNRVTRFSPAVVSLMIGTNDSVSGKGGREGYRSNVSLLVDQIRDVAAVPMLLTFNPIGREGDPTREDLPAYAQIMREVAEEKSAFLIDNYAQWESVGSDVTNSWLADPIHPNEIGHLMLVTKIMADLKILDPESATGSLKIT
jgi:acyl-CoA thioesterase-1